MRLAVAPLRVAAAVAAALGAGLPVTTSINSLILFSFIYVKGSTSWPSSIYDLASPFDTRAVLWLPLDLCYRCDPLIGT